jgi:hypothetical protein
MLKSDRSARSTPPSSSGPGRGPLKAKTGVRIPMGAQENSRSDRGCFALRIRQFAPNCLREYVSEASFLTTTQPLGLAEL